MKRPVCPCAPDCPDRKAACALTCQHGFAQYMAERNAEYEERARKKRIAFDASAGKKAAAEKRYRDIHRRKYS